MGAEAGKEAEEDLEVGFADGLAKEVEVGKGGGRGFPRGVLGLGGGVHWWGGSIMDGRGEGNQTPKGGARGGRGVRKAGGGAPEPPGKVENWRKCLCFL